MAALRSISHGANAVTLVGSNGATITLTKAQVVANFQAQTGTLAARVTATVLWARQQIGTALDIPASDIGFLFDGSNITGVIVGPGRSAGLPGALR